MGKARRWWTAPDPTRRVPIVPYDASPDGSPRSLTLNDRLEAADLLDECLPLDGPARRALLSERCRDRSDLRREVESLLEYLPDPVFESDAELDLSTEELANRLVGSEVGDCRLVELLALGGMGAVYRAEQLSTKRPVAVKLLRPDLLSAESRRRLRLEARVLAGLDHPAIARIHAAGIHAAADGHWPYLVMELVPDARPIHSWWTLGELPFAERLERFALLCDAVHHGHMKGVIHRDLKPANLLVGADGQPKVIDFGIARVTRTDTAAGDSLLASRGSVIGTIPYMAPERLEGDVTPDVRSDVYSLGVVLYELLAGRLPYPESRQSVTGTAAAIARGAPPAPSSVDRRYRGDLDTIVATAMARDPAARYDSASALAADLRSHLADEPIRARPVGRLARFGKLLRRNPGTSAALFAVFLALSIGLAVSLRATARAERALYLTLLAQGDLMADRQDVQGAKSVLERVPRRHRDEWPIRVLSRFASDAVDTAGFSEWNLFRGRLDPARRRLLASGWGSDPELVALGTSPARIEARIPLPMVGMGADWGVPLADGTPTVLAGLDDGRVVELRMTDGKPLREVTTVPTDAGRISDLALDPSGRRLAVAYAHDRLRLVGLHDGSELEIEGLADPAQSNWAFLEWSPDGETLGIAASGGGFLLDPASGRLARPVRAGCNAVAFSPDGERAAFLERSGSCEIALVASGESLVRREAVRPSWGIDWGPDGRSLAVVGRDHLVTIHDAATLAPVRILKGEAEPKWTVRFVSDRECMTLPGGEIFTVDTPPRTIAGPDASGAALDLAVPQVSFVDGGRWLLAVGPRGSVERIDPLLGSRTPIVAVPVENAIARLDAAGETIAIADAKRPGPIRLVRWRDGATREIPGRFLGPLAFAPDGARIAATGERGDAVIVRTADGTTEALLPRPAGNLTMSFAWADDDRLLWCLALGSSSARAGPDGAWSVDLDPDRSALRAWPEDRTHWVWIDLGNAIRRGRADEIGSSGRVAFPNVGPALALARHPSRPLTAIATRDGRLAIHDADWDAIVSDTNLKAGRITDVAWSPDGSMVAAIAADGTVFLIDSEPMSGRWPELRRRRDEAILSGGELVFRDGP